MAQIFLQIVDMRQIGEYNGNIIRHIGTWVIDMRKLLIMKRKERNLTQENVAVYLEISRSYYGRIEKGERNPPLPLILRIKRLFQYTNDDLFDNQD